MKTSRVLRLLVIVPMLLTFVLPTFAISSNYTYTYDFWWEEVASPDAYFVADQIMGSDYESVGAFRDPQGLYIKDNRIYICDSGNNRIIRIDYNAETGDYELVKVVNSVMINGEESLLFYPTDLCEDRNGDIFIADNKNMRILHLDSQWNFIKTFDKPTGETVRVESEFLPAKLVVDNADRVYVQSTNVVNGLLEYSMDGEFMGYMGASRVRVMPWDYFWRLLMTQAQKDRTIQFVPTEYNNVCLDYEGFLYVTTATFAEGAIYGDADPVRRLNAIGTDILVRNGYRGPDDKPIGDLWGAESGLSSRFVDVVALANDTYVTLDRVRGRLFAYDFQGNLLYAFGGSGSKMGYFQMPAAIEEMGYDLFVLDSKVGAVTRFTMTEYGNHINNALIDYKKGRYQESAAHWEQVLKMNGNYDFAYIGIGRAALQQRDYEKAMEYFKAKNDQENYGKAFTQYRKIWMEKNVIWIVLILLILIIVPKIIRFILKLRKEIIEA